MSSARHCIGWSTFPAGGAALGALIDRLIGNRPIYLARSTRATLRVTPMLSPARAGAALSLRF